MLSKKGERLMKKFGMPRKVAEIVENSGAWDKLTTNCGFDVGDSGISPVEVWKSKKEALQYLSNADDWITMPEVIIIGGKMVIRMHFSHVWHYDGCAYVWCTGCTYATADDPGKEHGYSRWGEKSQ